MKKYTVKFITYETGPVYTIKDDAKSRDDAIKEIMAEASIPRRFVLSCKQSKV